MAILVFEQQRLVHLFPYRIQGCPLHRLQDRIIRASFIVLKYGINRYLAGHKSLTAVKDDREF